MFYLPGTSWWRFVGWLVLGAAVYASYGYSTSVLGRKGGRPQQTPPFMSWMAAGFLAAGVGLFTIPHDSNIGQLAAKAMDNAAADHWRSLAGATLIVAGVVAVTIGGLLGRKRQLA